MMAATPRRRRAWESRHAPSAGGLSHRGDVQGLGVPPFVLALPIVEAAHLEGWVAVGTPTSRARGLRGWLPGDVRGVRALVVGAEGAAVEWRRGGVSGGVGLVVRGGGAGAGTGMILAVL